MGHRAPIFHRRPQRVGFVYCPIGRPRRQTQATPGDDAWLPAVRAPRNRVGWIREVRPPAAFQHGPRGAATFIADGYGEVLSAWIPGLSVARRLGSDWNGSPSRRSVLREVTRARSFCRPLRDQQLAGTRRSGSYRRGVVRKVTERRTGDGFYPAFCPSRPTRNTNISIMMAQQDERHRIGDDKDSYRDV